MLTVNDTRLNFYHLKLLSFVGLLPFSLDFENANIQLRLTIGRRVAFWLLFILAGSSTFFYGFTFVLSLYDQKYLNFSHIPLHTVGLLIHTLELLSQIELFIRQPGACATVFNELFKRCDRTTPFHWLSYTFQELFVVFIPVIIYAVIPLLIAIFVTLPDKIFSFYFFLSENNKTLWAFIICSCMDGFMQLFPVSMTSVELFIQSTFFLKIGDTVTQVDKTLRSIRNDDNCYHCLLTAAKECQRLHLMIGLFNKLFCNIIFMFKCSMLISTIMLWYTSIIFRRTDPIKAVAFAIIGVQAVLAFVVTFNDAFGVPEKISELKRNVRLSSRRLTRAEHKREIERLLWSVPEVGIKIGGFHTFQRTSTLEFLAFVTENIASLLVSYPPA